MGSPEKQSKAQEETQPEAEPRSTQPRLPVEVEVYIAPDGSVTFADLETGMLPAARELNPDAPSLAALQSSGAEPQEPASGPEGSDHDVSGAENPA